MHIESHITLQTYIFFTPLLCIIFKKPLPDMKRLWKAQPSALTFSYMHAALTKLGFGSDIMLSKNLIVVANTMMSFQDWIEINI
jgi:hypothetical protein